MSCVRRSRRNWPRPACRRNNGWVPPSRSGWRRPGGARSGTPSGARVFRRAHPSAPNHCEQHRAAPHDRQWVPAGQRQQQRGSGGDPIGGPVVLVLRASAMPLAMVTPIDRRQRLLQRLAPGGAAGAMPPARDGVGRRRGRPNMASSATSPPRMPTAFWPTSTTIIEPGGIARTARTCRGLREVTQRCTSTAWRCMSGSTAAPPPTRRRQDAEHRGDLQQRRDHRARSPWRRRRSRAASPAAPRAAGCGGCRCR